MKQTLTPLIFGLGMGAQPSHAAEPLPDPSSSLHYQVEVMGTDLDEIHTQAAKRLIELVEGEIKDSTKNYEITGFSTYVCEVDDQYRFSYGVWLVPVAPEHADRVVALRGTVWHGHNAQERVLEINSTKIPNWQEQMSVGYASMDLHYEVAQSYWGGIFHEAILATGDHSLSAK